MGYLDTAIYSVLQNHAGLTALVSDRVYRQHAPDNAVVPYVLFGQTSHPREVVGGALQDLSAAQYWVEVWDDDGDGALTTQAQVLAALVDYAGTVGTVVVQWVILQGSGSRYDPATERNSIWSQWEVWSSGATA